MASTHLPRMAVQAPQAHITSPSQSMMPDTVCIRVGKHPFLIPEDPLEAFHYIRELTIKSLQSYINEHATPREVAFIFNDGSLMEEEDDLDDVLEGSFFPRVRGAVRAETPSNVDDGYGSLRFLRDRLRRERNDEYAGSSEGGHSTMPGALRPRTVSEGVLADQPPLNHLPLPINNDRSKRKRSDECEKSRDGSGTYKSISTEVPTASTHALQSFVRPNNAPIVKHLSPTANNGQFRFWRNENPFIGDFLDLEDARRKTRKSLFWLRSNYVDGLISFRGQFAMTENVRERCTACEKHNYRGCTKLVTRTDVYVGINSCAWCLMHNSRCNVPLYDRWGNKCAA